MSKAKVQTMIIDALFEDAVCKEPEMNILKIVFTPRTVVLLYMEHSQGLKTTLNHMLKALERIDFIYLHTYYDEISKNLNNNSIYISDEDRNSIYISDEDCNFEVVCCYDSKYKISIFNITINRWLKWNTF